jgi:hypothetical protein
MQKDGIEQQVMQLQNDLNNFRKIIEEQGKTISRYSQEQESMKSNMQSYLCEIDKLKQENQNLKIHVETITNSHASDNNRHLLSQNSLSLNEIDARNSLKSRPPANLKNTSVNLDEQSRAENSKLGISKTHANFNEGVDRNGLLSQAPRVIGPNVGKMAKVQFDSAKIVDHESRGPQADIHDRSSPSKNGPLNVPGRTYTPEGQKRFLDVKSTHHTIGNIRKQRSESISARLNPSSFLKTIKYNEYLSRLANEEKSQKIKFLTEICNSGEKDPPSESQICVQNRLKAKTQQRKDINTSEHSELSRTVGHTFFKEELQSLKSNSESFAKNLISELDVVEKANINGPHKTNPQFKVGETLGSALPKTKFSMPHRKSLEKKDISFSYVSRSEEESGKSKIEAPIFKSSSPVKSQLPETVNLQKIYEDFLIVGCQKAALAKNIADKEINFSILFDLYTLDPKDPNNQNNEILKFMIPFTQKIKSVKIKNSIAKLNETLFQDDASSKNFEFFSISLNSSIGSEGSNEGYKNTQKYFKNGDLELLKETNSGLCFYYYCAKVEDYFIGPQLPGQSNTDHIEVHFFPKYFIVKSLYPFSGFFHTVLQQILSLTKRRRIERFVECIKNGKVDASALERVDCHGMAELELAAIMPLFEKLDQYSMSNNFEETLRLKLPNVSFNYTLPSMKNCSFAEAEFGFSRVLSQFAYEEFLFIYFSLLLEKTVVFVSEDMSSLSACISAFVCLMKPFKWPFPIIYSLPEDCLVMLGSPIPLLVGMNLPADVVINEVIPEHEKKTRADANSNIYVFIDQNLFFYDFESFDTMLIPQYDEFIEKLDSIYKKSFCQRPSNYFKLHKRKVGKSTATYLKKQNTTKMKEKLVNIDRTAQKKALEKSQIDRLRQSSLVRSGDDFQIFYFFRYFFNSFIISKLPHDRNISQFGKETKIREIDVNFFSTNPSDVEFLESFMKTQAFMYYIEHDFYGISNPNIDK